MTPEASHLSEQDYISSLRVLRQSVAASECDVLQKMQFLTSVITIFRELWSLVQHSLIDLDVILQAFDLTDVTRDLSQITSAFVCSSLQIDTRDQLSEFLHAIEGAQDVSNPLQNPPQGEHALVHPQELVSEREPVLPDEGRRFASEYQAPGSISSFVPRRQTLEYVLKGLYTAGIVLDESNHTYTLEPEHDGLKRVRYHYIDLTDLGVRIAFTLGAYGVYVMPLSETQTLCPGDFLDTNTLSVKHDYWVPRNVNFQYSLAIHIGRIAYEKKLHGFVWHEGELVGHLPDVHYEAIGGLDGNSIARNDVFKRDVDPALNLDSSDKGFAFYRRADILAHAASIIKLDLLACLDHLSSAEEKLDALQFVEVGDDHTSTVELPGEGEVRVACAPPYLRANGVTGGTVSWALSNMQPLAVRVMRVKKRTFAYRVSDLDQYIEQHRARKRARS